MICHLDWDLPKWVFNYQHLKYSVVNPGSSLRKLKTERPSWVTLFPVHPFICWHSNMVDTRTQHNKATHHSAQALFQKPPCCLGQSEHSMPPPPCDCHHLFDTMSGGCVLRSWPETTIHHHDASVLCKLPWHHQAKGTPEVLTQSKRISNTHTYTHVCALT